MMVYLITFNHSNGQFHVICQGNKSAKKIVSGALQALSFDDTVTLP